MASNTGQTTRRREMKKSILGLRRKNALRRDGSTEKSLPLNVPNAGEKAAKAKATKAK